MYMDHECIGDTNVDSSLSHFLCSPCKLPGAEIKPISLGMAEAFRPRLFTMYIVFSIYNAIA